MPNQPARTTEAAPPAQGPAQIKPADAIKQITQQFQPLIESLLIDSPYTVESFVAMLSTTLRNNPDLWETQPHTWLAAALRCAQLQMPPNDGTNRTWIIPRKGKAVFQLGYGGVLELARRAVPGTKFDGREVYPNDLFEIDYGTGHFTHVPYFARRAEGITDRGGEAFLWYVKVTYPDGGHHVHVLDKSKVDYHRSFSQRSGGNGLDMWRDSYDAAALKSVIVDMRRWLPASPLLQGAIASDGKTLDVRSLTPAGELKPIDEPKQIDVYQPPEAPDDDEVVDGTIVDDSQAVPIDPEDEAWVAAAKGGA